MTYAGFELDKLESHLRVVIALSVHILRRRVALLGQARRCRQDPVGAALPAAGLPGTLDSNSTGMRPGRKRDRRGTGGDRGVQRDRPPATPRRLL